MHHAVLSSANIDRQSVAKPTRPATQGRRRLTVTVIVTLAVGAAVLSRQGLFTPGSGLGYTLGLVGGVMMLALLLYPLRKHLACMQAWGAARHWFRAHMWLGILGPALILLHSTFRIGSINAGVALTCMLLVAGSGIIGRFIYAKIHHGLYGRRATLQECQDQLGLRSDDIHSQLHFPAVIEAQLKHYESTALQAPRSALHGFARAPLLIVRSHLLYRTLRRDLDHALQTAAREHGWHPRRYQERLHATSARLRGYLSAVRDTAQFNTYERLFSLWHVLHVPFVYMLVISAIAHVVAVHIY